MLGGLFVNFGKCQPSNGNNVPPREVNFLSRPQPTLVSGRSEGENSATLAVPEHQALASPSKAKDIENMCAGPWLIEARGPSVDALSIREAGGHTCHSLPRESSACFAWAFF